MHSLTGAYNWLRRRHRRGHGRELGGALGGVEPLPQRLLLELEHREHLSMLAAE